MHLPHEWRTHPGLQKPRLWQRLEGIVECNDAKTSPALKAPCGKSGEHHAKTLCVFEALPAACGCQMQRFALEHAAIPGSRLPKYSEEVLPTALSGLRTAHETLADIVKGGPTGVHKWVRRCQRKRYSDKTRDSFSVSTDRMWWKRWSRNVSMLFKATSGARSVCTRKIREVWVTLVLMKLDTT